MTELAALNVRLTGDASGLEGAVTSATKEINRVGDAADRANTRTTGLTTGFGRLSNMSGQTRSQLQNVGFQLQDIAIQLQGGTRASVVFAQQGSQILSIFGPLGALFGTLAAVGIPALAFAFDEAGNRAKTFEDALSDLKDLQIALDESTDILTMGVDELAKKYGGASQIVRQFAVAQAQAVVAQARRRLQDQIFILDDVIERYGRGTKVVDEFGESIDISEQLRNLQRDLGVTAAQSQQLFTAFETLRTAQTFDQQQAALARIDELLASAGVTADELPAELNRALIEMRNLVFQANELETAINKANEASSNMTFGPPRRGGPRRESTMLPELVATPDDTGDGGGRIGGGVNPLIAQLDAVRNALMTQEEAQIASFQRQQETLQSALEQQLLTRQEYNALMQDAQSQHADALERIDAYRYGSGLQMAQTFFGDMANAVQTGGNKMVRAAQIFGAAEALINAYRAYSATLADPTLPWWARIPKAAAVLSAGLGAVNAIKGASTSGGATASAATSAATGGAAAAPSVSRNVAIQLTGGDMFSRDQVINLINSINEAVEDGAIVRLV